MTGTPRVAEHDVSTAVTSVDAGTRLARPGRAMLDGQPDELDLLRVDRRRSDPCSIINGLGSQCTNYRVEWCEMFAAEGFRVIRFDNRDVGLSTHFDDVAPDLDGGARPRSAPATRRRWPTRWPTWPTDAIAVLDDLGLDTAHVMGLSMGGMIIQHLAISHADRLRSITSVMSSTGDPDVGHASPEAVELMTAPSPTDRDSYIARTIKGLHTWGSPAWQDDQRTAAIAGEAFDRAFDPAGQARQYLAILSDGSRTEALALGRPARPRDARHGRPARRPERRTAHGRGHPRSPLRADRRHGPRLPARGLAAVGRAGHHPRPRRRRELDARPVLLGGGDRRRRGPRAAGSPRASGPSSRAPCARPRRRRSPRRRRTART